MYRVTKLKGVGPVDNRPFTKKLPPFKKEEEKNGTFDT